MPLPQMQVGTHLKHGAFLTEIVQEFQRNGIRTSIFVDPVLDMIEGSKIERNESNCIPSCAPIWFRK
jgi:pyridoxine 5'-phosphate synthase PdxJ